MEEQKMETQMMNLLMQAVGGHRNAAYQLWIEHIEKQWVVSLLSNFRTFSQEDQEDLLADLRDEFVLAITKLQNPSCLRPFVIRFVKNFCIDRLRKRERQQRQVDEFRQEILSQHNDVEPDLAFERAGRQKSVASVLQAAARIMKQKLKLEEREVIELMILHGKTQAETAKILNVSPKTVKNRYTAGLQKIDEDLQRIPSYVEDEEQVRSLLRKEEEIECQL